MNSSHAAPTAITLESKALRGTWSNGSIASADGLQQAPSLAETAPLGIIPVGNGAFEITLFKSTMAGASAVADQVAMPESQQLPPPQPPKQQQQKEPLPDNAVHAIQVCAQVYISATVLFAFYVGV